MAKTFNTLFEKYGSDNSYSVPADDDREAKDIKPRSKGEEKFVAKHTTKVTKHPVAKDNQFKSTNKPSLHKGFESKHAGEMKAPKQGTSEAGNNGDGGNKQTPSRRGDQMGGETSTVKAGSSDVRVENVTALQDERNALQERIDEIEQLLDESYETNIDLEDGNTAFLTKADARNIDEVRGRLTDFNKKQFNERLQKDEASFKHVLSFVRDQVRD